MSHQQPTIGVILAGGTSRRMPGGKPSALLGARSLLARAVDLVGEAGLHPVVCARAATALPPTEATIWVEPADASAPHHPLAGIAWALTQAGAPIVVLPVDLPFLPPAVLAALATEAAPGAVLGAQGRPSALVAGLHPQLAPALLRAARAGAPTLRTLTESGVRIRELDDLPSAPDPVALMNVNDPAALAEAEAILQRRERRAG